MSVSAQSIIFNLRLLSLHKSQSYSPSEMDLESYGDFHPDTKFFSTSQMCATSSFPVSFCLAFLNIFDLLLLFFLFEKYYYLVDGLEFQKKCIYCETLSDT